MLSLASFVQTKRQAIDAQWPLPESRLVVAPGAEIVEHAFEHLGGEFNQLKDAPQIVGEMLQDEIAARLWNRSIAW